MRRPLRNAALALLALPVPLFAGGYLTLDPTSNQPYRWDTSHPIVFNLDRGSLGLLSKADADALAIDAINKWSNSNIDTCALTFQRGADLEEDYGDGRGSEPAFFLNEGRGDGLTPVIYDQEGRMTATLFAGAEFTIAGYAGPNTVDPATGHILEGLAILNGKFFDGQPGPTDMSREQFEGVLVHEFGHMLNMDHAVFNDAFGLALADSVFQQGNANYTHYPTMHSIIHPQAISLEFDDRAWISNLYPSPAFAQTAAFSGRVRLNDALPGTPLDGVNVVARSATDVQLAISCVSGYDNGNPAARRSGDIFFPGLPPGSRWVFDIEPIPGRFIGLSGVGTVDPPIALPGPVEFINEAGVEGLTDRTTISTTFQAGAAATTTPGIDLQMNIAPTATVVTEVDPEGAQIVSKESHALTFSPGVPLEIRGIVDPAEGGDVKLPDPDPTDGITGDDPVEDWYEIGGTAAIELERISLKPAAGDDADLIVVSLVSGAPTPVAFSRTTGAGVAELIETQLDSSIFGIGTPQGLGKIYIGVTSRNGSPGGAYTLRIEGAHSDRAAMVIASAEVNGTTLTLRGRGFRSGSGGPFVLFPNRSIAPMGVQVVSDGEVVIPLAALPGAATSLADPITIQLRNSVTVGGYGGRISMPLGLTSLPEITLPTGHRDAQQAQLDLAPATAAADRNRDKVVDAADLDL